MERDGFVYKGTFYDKKNLGKMSYAEIEYLIETIQKDIDSNSEIILPYTDKLRSSKTEISDVPENIIKKLKYKDALNHFIKTLKDCRFEKKISIERAFIDVCRESMEEENFQEFYSLAEKKMNE